MKQKMNDNILDFGTSLDENTVAVWCEDENLFGIYSRKGEGYIWTLVATAINLKILLGDKK